MDRNNEGFPRLIYNSDGDSTTRADGRTRSRQMTAGMAKAVPTREKATTAQRNRQMHGVALNFFSLATDQFAITVPFKPRIEIMVPYGELQL